MLRSAQHDMQESSRDFVKAVVIPGFQDLLKLREPAQALGEPQRSVGWRGQKGTATWRSKRGRGDCLPYGEVFAERFELWMERRPERHHCRDKQSIKVPFADRTGDRL